MHKTLQDLGGVCGDLSGAVTYFLLEYTSSSGTTCSSRELQQTDCDGGVCVDVFSVTSDCPGDSYTVSVRAGNNYLGLGPATRNMYGENQTQFGE